MIINQRSTLPGNIMKTSTQYAGQVARFLIMSTALALPLPALADIVYGTVEGVTADNLTLIVYKGANMVTSTAIKSSTNNKFEYQLNLPPGSYRIRYKNLDQPIVNYPGTNRVNIYFK